MSINGRHKPCDANTERDDQLEVNFICHLFADSLLSGINEYEMFIPKLVSRHGEFISYDVTSPKLSRHSRTRRAVPQQGEILTDSDISEYRIFYRFSVFGKEFHFDLTLNTHLLSPKFSVEYYDKNGLSETSGPVSNCYYVGESREPYLSTAAISNCYGLVRKQYFLISFIFLSLFSLLLCLQLRRR